MKGINSITPQITEPIIVNGRRLVPRDQHSGPVLKLTKKDKVEIEQLQKELNRKIAAAIKFRNSIEGNRNLSIDARRNCYDSLFDLENDIESLKNKIRKIKIARFEKQKESLKK